MRQIVFVDDDPNILEGLKNRLHRQRKKWQMRFVGSGKEALELLEQSHVDVVVSDMRMPEMDGAELLKRIQQKHPQVVRIILSGHSELEASLRAVPVAHQFLNKPCEAGVLESVVERACSLQALIGQETLMQVVGGIDSLPSLPRVHSQLVTALAKDRTSAAEVARILAQDMAISAKVLQIVNSAFFRLARTISKVEEAVNFLGLNTVKQIVLAVEVYQSHGKRAHPGISLDALQNHALLVANVAATLVGERALREDAAVAGLLHDIGKLVLAVELPKQVEKVLQRMQGSGCRMNEAEDRELGVSHAEVGGYLLGIWGLPYPTVEAVANHHSPSRVATDQFGILGAVHVANALVNQITATGTGSTPESSEAGLDLEFLERVGVRGRLGEWTECARKLASERGSKS